MSVTLIRNTLVLCATAFLSLSVMANDISIIDTGVKSIYGANQLKAVGDGLDPQVEKLGTGVCSVGPTPLGIGCCSGFAIGKDLVMTNFHCLACLYEFNAATKAKAKQQKEDHASMNAARVAAGLAPLPAPIGLLTLLEAEITNNPKQLSKRTDVDLNWVNFGMLNKDIKFEETEEGTKVKIAESVMQASYRVKELLAHNKELDYIVIRLEKQLADDRHIFTLDSRPSLVGQKLLSISHPGRSPFPNMKVYDNSDDCQLAKTNVTRPGVKQAFGHQCDTNGGSSGSPVIDRATGRVVGLHNMGGARAPHAIVDFLTGEPIVLNKDFHNTYNSGVKMWAIIGDLGAQTEFPNNDLTVD